MMKRNKAILCALAGIGFITSVGTVKANAMTNTTKTTLKSYEVEELMSNLPYTINIDLKDQFKTTVDVIKAELAYKALPENKKCYVDQSAIDNLKHTERTLQRVFCDEGKALDLVYKISKLEEQVGYDRDTRTVNNKAELKSNRSDIQKQIETLEKNYQSIDYSIRDKNGLSDFMSDLSVIEFSLYDTAE